VANGVFAVDLRSGPPRPESERQPGEDGEPDPARERSREEDEDAEDARADFDRMPIRRAP
jgi:hypothetical protein